ncbi:helix-turn-helix domain-containing protein [Paenibacillus qinlingensis]|uniref:helix-turn-helix domain-containing protein n=1 Tax=Paenibacillus qinlingensis TaxID=1837343 RepID=UPI0015638F61|nr:AraC family transcriptional regulator [Paenibacillus qinlingensis]NQX62120.1 helix-turn-helix transcriptional regulator [Paenibacillus qinlingensis]
MQLQNTDQVQPKLLSHMYWREKSAFQLQEDSNEFWVLFAVENGSFSYQIQEHEGTATFGDLVLCPPGAIFRREVIQPLSFHVMLLQWGDSAGHPLAMETQVPSGKIAIQDLNRLSSNYAYLKKWFQHEGIIASSLRQHLLTDLWMLIVEEAYSASPEAVSPWTAGLTNNKDAIIHEATQRLHELASSTCIMKDIAMELGLTQVQFTRRFKKSTGMLPIDYLTTLRLQKVQQLLLDSDMTLGQIAGQCGFENEFYLSRVFKKRMHVTPSSFRKLHRL